MSGCLQSTDEFADAGLDPTLSYLDGLFFVGALPVA